MIKMNRVLYVSPNAVLGGAERVCQLLAKYHDRSQFEPAVVFLRDGPLVEDFKSLGVETFVAPMVRMRQIGRHRDLVHYLSELIKSEKINLVHSCMSYGHYFGGRAARIAGIKNVWFQHGPVMPRDYFFSLIATDRILTNSRFTKVRQSRRNLRSFPISVVYPGVELPHLPPTQIVTKRNEFRRHLGVTGQEFIIGTVGRLEYGKGQLELLKAFSQALKINARLKLAIVGSSYLGNIHYESSLREYVKDLNLEAHVFFTGFLPDLDAIYFGVDLLVQASRNPEGFGLASVEAAVRNTPVIATAQGGVLDVIRDGETGVLVPPADINALKDAILKMAGDHVYRESLVAEARRAALQNFSATAMTRNVERVYLELLAR